MLEQLETDTPLSVCLPSADDGTLVCAPLVSVGYGTELDDALPGLEYPLIGERDDPANAAALDMRSLGRPGAPDRGPFSGL